MTRTERRAPRLRWPVPLLVGWTVLVELARALTTPLRLLAFLPRRRHWLASTRAALEDASPPTADDALARFLAGRRPPAGRPAHVLLSCGEMSGETCALHLVDAVRSGCRAAGLRAPRFTAFGGHRLAEAGVALRHPLAEHAIFGIRGVFAALPFICRAFATFLRALRDDPPDLVVLIDYPGLHLVFATAARRRGVPVVHYVAPQYWAWGPWRLARYRRAVDATLTILPFEPAYFGRHGLPSAYVGHPLLDELARAGSAPAANEACGDAPTLVLMPGSRGKEIELHLRPLLELARRLRAERPGLRVVVPHRAPKRIARIRALLASWGATDEVHVAEGDPAPWLRVARAVLVKSGTGSLEACLHGAPSVVVYVVDSWVTRFVLHRLLTVPVFAGANLCMGRRIVPELAVERPAQWDDAYAELVALWDDGPPRTRCLDDLAALRARLGAPGASERAARFVLPFCPPAEESRTS
ncbi:MAG: lipid-A-disaccharide synthase [Planctomycetes bacterium]|nr:lipid-A-disaccharide synthase [Planctomycetota bacterium]